MKKKFLATAAALITILSSMAFCDPTVTTATEDGSTDCEVTAELESSYTVQIPTKLELTNTTGNTYSVTYNVGAKGNLNGTAYVEIKPKTTYFTMTGTTTSSEVTARITQEKKTFGRSGKDAVIGTDTFATLPGTISAEITQSDAYTGTMTFDYALK